MNPKNLIPLKPPFNLKRVWRKFWMVAATSSLLPSSIRAKFYKWGGVGIKGKVFIGSGVQFDGMYPNLIEIGRECVITSGTHILTHYFNPTERKFYIGRVNIGERVFIGMNSLIVNSVDIGDYAVIGAGSVVTHDIPSGEIWAGNPARFIRKV